MTCTHVTLPGGLHAIVCARGHAKVKRCSCGRVGTLLCDWKVGNGKTCDKPVCDKCADHVAEDKDLCQVHSKAFSQWKAHRS